MTAENIIPAVFMILLLAGCLLFLFRNVIWKLKVPQLEVEVPDSSGPQSVIRNTLFGDVPLSSWGKDGAMPPWSQFAEACRSLSEGRTEEAVDALKQIIATPDLESRHYLQAWQFMRPLGHLPDAEEKQRVLGVVVEVHLPEGLDLLAAYADHSARYHNFSGSGVVWEHPDTSLDADIDLLLTAAAAIVPQIGPWKGARPGPPPRNHMRLNFLTPGGLCFGQGPLEVLAADPLGGEAVKAATNLMVKLIGKAAPKES